MTWRLAIHAIDLILSKQFLLGVHLQLELGGDNLEDTGGWELCQTLQVASGQASTCSPEISSSFLPGSWLELAV